MTRTPSLNLLAGVFLTALLAVPLTGCSREVPAKVAFSFESNLDDSGSLHLKGSQSKTGKLSYVEGLHGKAIDVTEGWVEVETTGLDLSRGLSVECWVKSKELKSPESGVSSAMAVNLGKLDPGIPAGIYGVADLGIFIPHGPSEARTASCTATGTNRNGWQVTSPKPFPVNQWVHLAMVQDPVNNKLTLFVDGESVGEATTTGPLAPISHLRIGQYLPGCVDEVRIFDQVISNSQIQADAKKR